MRSFLRRVLAVGFFAACFVTVNGTSTPAQAQTYADLQVVKPVKDCAALASADWSGVAGAAVKADAQVIDTPKGQFCHVTGTIAPAIGFEVDLPTAKWTQRFLQAGCGGLCGNINASIGNAGKCQPAVDGEFVVAASDLGHQAAMGAPGESDFAADPQKRIDFAYRANHVTALLSKALIKDFYGQPQKYAYFSGCSDGGREAMMEAERYPDDFDGISAGAPAMLFDVQNSFFHSWGVFVNTRPDGTHILLADKVPVLHAAVIEHCDTLDGNKDGLLSDPRACKVDPSWVLCKPGATDTSKCLTAEEWGVAAKYYEGPTDAAGHHFLPGGLQPGGEMLWGGLAPREATSKMNSMAVSMSKVVLENPSGTDADPVHYAFTTDQFTKVNLLRPLNDATNTDLRPFAKHGKLIMWHGWSDFSIAPMITVAYYKAVQKELGVAPTDKFLRLFMLPGVGHCGGGDGFPQVDTLSALMAWTEKGIAPAQLVAEQIPQRQMGGPGGPGGPAGAARQGGPGGPPGAPAGAPNGPDGRGGGPGMSRVPAPYAREEQQALASRPIYPFPTIARYSGSGDPKAASSYVPGSSGVKEPATIEWYGSNLLAPDFQKNYAVKDGKLVVEGR